jgi:hypothetical protein
MDAEKPPLLQGLGTAEGRSAHGSFLASLAIGNGIVYLPLIDLAF